jgi:arylsulfatase
MPTLLELAGAEYPQRHDGNETHPLRGISLAPAFDGKPISRTAPMFSEHEKNAFIMDGDWKLVGKGVAASAGPEEELWELYDLSGDRTELNNLVSQRPERAAKMMAAWREWADRDMVYPKPKKAKRKKRKKR